MPVTAEDVDKYLPGRGQNWSTRLNRLLKLMIENAPTSSGGAPNLDGGDAASVPAVGVVIDGGGA